MRNNYLVMLRNGKELALSRVEDEDKSALGLWKWSFNQNRAVFLDFNECSVLASEVILISKN